MSVGIHISKNSHALEKTKHTSYMIAIKTEVELLHMSAFALFMLGPLNKSKISMDYTSIKQFCIENNIEIWPHASYISSGVWNVNFKNRHENKSLMYLRDIKDHLVIGKQLGVKGVVFHLPRHPIATVLETMEILSDCKVINSIRKNEGVLPAFTVEMPASRPNDELTYETSQKLNALVKAINADKQINLPWNICIDSCHEYAGGVNFATDWDKWEADLTNETRDKIKLIHFNGASGKNFGTGKDGHIIPLSKDDAIWSHLISDEFRDYIERSSIDDVNKVNLYDKLSHDELTILKNSQFNSIIQWCKKHNIAMIMEINRGKYQDIKLAMDIINSILGKKGGSLAIQKNETQIDDLINDLKL